MHVRKQRSFRYVTYVVSNFFPLLLKSDGGYLCNWRNVDDHIRDVYYNASMMVGWNENYRKYKIILRNYGKPDIEAQT